MKKLISLSLVLLIAFANITYISAEDYLNPYELVTPTKDTVMSGVTYMGLRKCIVGSSAAAGSYAKFGAFDFSDAPGSIEINLGATDSTAALDIRVDNPVNGKVIATVVTDPASGNFFTASAYRAEISSSVTGVHDIYIVWRGKANLMSFKFSAVTSLSVKGNELTNAIQLGNGYLEVPFNNMIDASTVDGNVMLTDENGALVDGFETIVEGRNVLVLFDSLDLSGTYTLIVTSGLKSKNGYYCDEFTKNLTVETDLEVAYDFSGDQYVVDEEPPDSNGLIFVSNDVKGDKSNFTVKTEDGFKFIRLKANREQIGSCLVLDLNDIGYDEYIELTFKVRLGSDTGAISSDSKTICQVVDSTKTGYGYTVITSRFKGASVSAYSNQVWQGFGLTETMSGNTSLSYNNTDEAGFTDVKLILKKDKDSEYVVVEMYNPYDPASEPFVKMCNSELIKISKLKEVALVHFYPVKNSVLSDYIDIKDIKYVKKSFLKTLYNNTSEADIDSDGIDVLFNQRINENTLSGITLKEKDSEELIPCSPSLVTGKMVNVNPEYYMLPGKTYVITMEGVKSTAGASISQSIEFTVPGSALQSKMYDAQGNETTDISAVTKITATEFAQDSYVIICANDADGRISKIVSGTGVAELDGLDTIDWNNIKIYTWEKNNGKVSPLSSEVNTISRYE